MIAPRAKSLPGLTWRTGTPQVIRRSLPEEVPVALVFNGTTQAVMMATPGDLIDFGTGFALTEGIIDAPSQIERTDILHHSEGIEVQMWLTETEGRAFEARRRSMLGPVGCGLCGIESLSEATRQVPVVTSDLRITPAEVDAAVLGLRSGQPLHDQTRATHAAAFFVPGRDVVFTREDVGRHNALDKLVGALALAGTVRSMGAVVLTSRVSVDMVQKCAMAGIPVLIAISAPTAHALRVADAAGITVVALARGDGFDLFTHPERLSQGGTHAA